VVPLLTQPPIKTTNVAKTATIKQLLTTVKQIEAAEQKLLELTRKRTQQVKELGLRTPPHWGDRPAENLLTIDGAPARLWISANGNVRLEQLEFGSKTGGFQ
jgi:hypothetical protein